MTTTAEPEGIMAVRTFPPFTAREYVTMAADQAATARRLAAAGNLADAEIWRRWSEQTAAQAEALSPGGLAPLTTEEWDGD